jgi:hypothetical protein
MEVNFRSLRSFCWLLVLMQGMNLPAFGQKGVVMVNKEGDDPYDDIGYFMSGVNYLSDNVYLGRKDTSVLPYVSPYIGYHFKNGIYGKGSLSFTSVDGTHIDQAAIEAGWDHSFGEHFEGGVFADRYFYNKNSVSVRANTLADMFVTAQYSNKVIEPTLKAGLDVNRKSTDEVVAIGADHEIVAAGGKMKITPTVFTYISTEHYLDEYFTNRINKKEKKKLDKALANANRFVPMDYECSVKMAYMTPEWLFLVQPAYIVPVNPATVKLPNGNIVPERISNSFVIEMDICHR